MAEQKKLAPVAPIKDKKTGRFLPGNSGGPGKPKGARNKLGEAFIADMYHAWQEHGKDAILRVIEEKPEAFLATITKILPQKVEVDKTEELTITITHVRSGISRKLDKLAHQTAERDLASEPVSGRA